MFRVESCNSAYQYCTNNWKPFVKETRDYLLAMIPIVNLIFLQYRCHQAQKHIASPEVQANIRHFFEVMKRCIGVTIIAAIAGIFHAIYSVQKRSIGITRISQFLFLSSTIASALLEHNQGQIFKKTKDADNAALQEALGPAKKELTHLDADWLSLLSPQLLIWISRMFRDCVSTDITVLDRTAPSNAFVSGDDIMGMQSPIRLLILESWRNKGKKNAGFSLMLCGTGDDHNARALINIIFHEHFIREVGWRVYPEQYKNFVHCRHDQAKFFFNENYTIKENEEPTNEIEALSRILQGYTYESQGIHWQLDHPRNETKSSRTAEENN